MSSLPKPLLALVDGSRRPLAAALLLGVFLAPALAGDPPPSSVRNFIRVVDDPDGGEQIQLAVRRYRIDKEIARKRSKTPLSALMKLRTDLPEVHLYSLIHVAERGYYQQVARELKSYDLVLYEAMGFAQVPPDKGLSVKAARVLVSQQHALRPQGRRWRLADVPIETQFRAMSLPKSLMKRQLASSSRQLTSIPRKLLINRFRDPEEAFKALPTQFLILQRNSVAFAEVIKACYQGHRRIAVVYGAAHMPDLERRLTREFDYRLVGSRWLTALHEKKRTPKRPRLY